MTNTPITQTLDGGHVITYNDMLPTVDDGIAFAIGQLSSLEATIYETKYRKIVYQEFIPVDTSQPEWVDTIDYISYDAVTMGKFIAANGQDLPESDINASKSPIRVYYGGNSYRWSLDEMRKSQQLRIPLDATKGKMSFRGFQEHAQRVAFQGDAARGLTGLFNGANVQLSNSLLDFSSATGEAMVSYLNQRLIDVNLNSAETHLADVFVMPSSDFATISEKKMDTGSDTTVLEYFKMNNYFTAVTNQPLTIRKNLELETAGVGGVKRYMAYELNSENLVMHMPMPWRSVAPQPDGLTVKVPSEYKFGGVEFRFPGSAAYHDNVA